MIHFYYNGVVDICILKISIVKAKNQFKWLEKYYNLN